MPAHASLAAEYTFAASAAKVSGAFCSHALDVVRLPRCRHTTILYTLPICVYVFAVACYVLSVGLTHISVCSIRFVESLCYTLCLAVGTSRQAMCNLTIKDVCNLMCRTGATWDKQHGVDVERHRLLAQTRDLVNKGMQADHLWHTATHADYARPMLQVSAGLYPPHTPPQPPPLPPTPASPQPPPLATPTAA